MMPRRSDTFWADLAGWNRCARAPVRSTRDDQACSGPLTCNQAIGTTHRCRGCLLHVSSGFCRGATNGMPIGMQPSSWKK